jgi:hypothetical protein
MSGFQLPFVEIMVCCAVAGGLIVGGAVGLIWWLT